MRTLMTLVISAFLMPILQGGDLPLPNAAKLLSMVAKSSNDGPRVSCKDTAMAGELQKHGIEINASARILWTESAAEARLFSAQGKCVVGPNPALLPAGAALVIFEDGGRPKLMVNPRNLQKSGVSLSDQILKAAMSGQ